MPREWDTLPNDTQIKLAQQALNRASQRIAIQAEVLADEIECGHMSDCGGADALRLFAAVVRVNSDEEMPAAGIA